MQTDSLFTVLPQNPQLLLKQYKPLLSLMLRDRNLGEKIGDGESPSIKIVRKLLIFSVWGVEPLSPSPRSSPVHFLLKSLSLNMFSDFFWLTGLPWLSYSSSTSGTISPMSARFLIVVLTSQSPN